MKTYSIALIPGDGIGRDVTDATWPVLTKAAGGSGFRLEGRTFPWSCAFYKETADDVGRRHRDTSGL
jgi:tartrate dehydrogenase/decarboxylase / D-malate dehydrogenase